MRLLPPNVSAAGGRVRRTRSAVAATVIMAPAAVVHLPTSSSRTAHARTPAGRRLVTIYSVMGAVIAPTLVEPTALAAATRVSAAPIRTALSIIFVRRAFVYRHDNGGDDSQGSVLTQRELRRTLLFVASVTKGKGKGWGPTSGPRPAFFPLFTNVLEVGSSKVHVA